MLFASVVTGLLLARGASAAVALYGAVCTYSNAYYSQCLPGTATSTTTTTTTTTTTSTSPGSTCTSVSTSNYCGQWDSVVTTPYTMYLDQWGISGATGSDCAQITSICNNVIKWSTTWSWSGGSGVKTYTNINANQNLNKQLSAISTIPSTWSWTQTSSGTLVANIAYDLFTSATSGGSNAYEIMIWLANYNAGPISYNYGSDGKPVAIASSLSLAGTSWNLYYGSNGANLVYSFLPVSGTVSNFSGNLNLFLKYLTTNQTLPSSQYLTTVQSGTEATSGSATLTSTYSVAIN
ncbi:concanavalin A-like lectin/glucanase domain-containing protein [Auriculariales sp. MPI-PUGE-AT-0066]|nr:concanavalin A-like lectin/glucanase domain-containing protein [Auriculariales sp. MPI-PUGE-AT-0066]